MSRQGGGIGTLGVGETNTELMKRHWRGEIKKVTDQLDKIGQAHNAQLEQRKRAGFKTISIVGYTNAGKSSLFNLLTNENVLVENALFATLDSSVSKIYIPQIEKEILLTDTIGFIRNLPPHLIQAFKSTLMESVHADILLHVIDVSDSEVAEKIHVVNNILHELGIHLDAHMIYVFNKIDIASNFDEEGLRTKYAQYSPIFISVNKQKGIDKIFEVIAKRLEKEGQAQPNTPEK